MRKQYPFLNNALVRALALLWCGIPTAERPHRAFGKVYAKRVDRPLELIVADGDAHCNGEYKAVVGDFLFHRMSAMTAAETDELLRLVRLFGLHVRDGERRGSVTVSKVRERFAEALFWHRSQLPKGVKPILLMSNGHRVRGYWRRAHNTVEIYRPNPNSGAYRPLPCGLSYAMGLCYV